jgi:Bacterial inner membrane protein
MQSDFLVHATGLAALVINVCALLCRCEIALRRQSVAAGCLWAINNVLLGAHSAAALTVVSASRTATAASTLERGRIARRNAFLTFAALTLGAGLLTWNGWTSGVTLAASVMSTYAMFYMRGVPLRLSMLAASLLWMVNAWQVGSWEQMAANVITAGVAAYGAWSLARRPA